MRAAFRFIWLPLAAAVLAWPGDGNSQTFAADYALSRSASLSVRPDSGFGAGLFSLGPVRVGPALRAGSDFSGAGLSLAGRNWFGQVGVDRSAHVGTLPTGAGSTDVLRIAGGYRWSDGQSLSLQLSRGRGGERLGLAANYDWPRYFVRLSYDTGLDPLPSDNLRFSAGMRF